MYKRFLSLNRRNYLFIGFLFSILSVSSFFSVSVKAQDKTMLQGFYWDVTLGGVWYDSLAHYAPFFGQMGINSVWFPSPAKGATGGLDVGYTPYDYYDLGEFNSSGGNQTSENGSSIPTRYGTRSSLQHAIQTLKSYGIDSYADAVLNHRAGGSLEPNVYKQWFTNSGGSLYGVHDSTYTAFPLTYGSGRISSAIGQGNENFFPNAAVNPSNTFDFYNENQFGYFQMYVNGFGYDVALHDGAGNNLAMGDSLSVWANWLIDEIGFNGFRVDFVKGIHPEFLKRWADFGSNKGKFVVGELYDGSNDRLKDWLNRHSGAESPIAVFDFNLRFAYKEWSDQGSNYDIRALQGRGLVQAGGVAWERIVHFVDNHDFDRNNYENRPSGDGHSPVMNSKHLMYAHMLALPGTATIWYRDLFWYGLRNDIALLTKLRSKFISGGYEILTARGDTFWPGNASEDPKNVLVIQRSGNSDSTGAIVAINKSNLYDIGVWLSSSKWENTKLIDITGHIKDTLEVFADKRVFVKTAKNSYSVFVPVGTKLEFSNNISLTDWGPIRSDLLLGEIINPEIGLKSEAFFDKDSLALSIRLDFPSGKKELHLDTVRVVKAYDELKRTISGLELSEVGNYTLNAWLNENQSDTIKVSFSVADTVGAPLFRMDGQFNESAYKKLAERELVDLGFGANKVVQAVYYGFDNDSLYFGIEGKFVVGEGDGIGFMLDVNSKNGLIAGSSIGKKKGATGFLNPSETKNSLSKFDFEVDYGFSLLTEAPTKTDISVVNYSLPDSGGFRLNPMIPNGLSAISGPTGSAAMPKNSIRYSMDLGNGEKRGIEFSIAKSALVDESFSGALEFRFFTFVISSTAYFSNVLLPGQWTGKKDTYGNPGFNVDFSTALSGPYHSDWFNLAGEIVLENSTEEMNFGKNSFMLHSVFPNPFNPTTSIRYDLKHSGKVRLSVMNVLGQEVQILTNEQKSKGSFSTSWNAAGMASGVYFLRLQTADGIQVQKMTLIK